MAAAFTNVIAGSGEFTGSGVGAMTLTFADELPYPATALSIVYGSGAVREVGINPRDLTSVTLSKGGRQSAYIAFTAATGTKGSGAAIDPSFTSIVASCETHDGWWKGNLHTHTNESDGNVAPGAVVAWYFGHGYDFVSLSDHDEATAYPSHDMLVLRGTEVTGVSNPVLHIVVANIENTIAGGTGTDNAAIESVIAAAPAGSVAYLAHPGWQSTLTVAEITAASNLKFIEVFNGVPGIGLTETLWDDVLLARAAAGNHAPLYGVAADDAHVFPGTSGDAAPGRGWIMVRASEGAPTAEAIVSAMHSGEFYFSTGVALAALERTVNTVSIEIEPKAGTTYEIKRVVGRSAGTTISTTSGTSRSYTLVSGDIYARLVAIGSDGKMAWSQPVFAA